MSGWLRNFNCEEIFLNPFTESNEFDRRYITIMLMSLITSMNTAYMKKTVIREV